MELLLVCEHCGESYLERKSTSGLRLTFCTSLCEGREFGMTIRDWLNVKRKPDAEITRRLIEEFKLLEIHERAEQIGRFFRAMKEAEHEGRI